mmetsp:Transcript_34233/g.91375  ORF Transcript_34233/g.91375 Transcript_34233/m.91375 type:complete len:87 (+) Transcript_34233:1187-1447(+)
MEWTAEDNFSLSSLYVGATRTHLSQVLSVNCVPISDDELKANPSLMRRHTPCTKRHEDGSQWCCEHHAAGSHEPSFIFKGPSDQES